MIKNISISRLVLVVTFSCLGGVLGMILGKQIGPLACMLLGYPEFDFSGSYSDGRIILAWGMFVTMIFSWVAGYLLFVKIIYIVRSQDRARPSHLLGMVVYGFLLTAGGQIGARAVFDLVQLLL